MFSQFEIIDFSFGESTNVKSFEFVFYFIHIFYERQEDPKRLRKKCTSPKVQKISYDREKFLKLYDFV